MKRLLAMVWLIALGLPLVASAEFLEGVEYVRIPKQPVETGAKIEVREFFWYGCPHCYALEPSLEAWLKKIPKNAQFVRTPAVFNERWAVHARAYYAFESLGLIGKMHEPLFRALHQDKRPLFDADSLAAFVVERGGDRKAFLDAYNSFGVATSVNRATQLGRAFGVQSVPTLFVDGQYMTNANIAGGYDKVPQVLNFLIQKAAAERRGKR
ncbi:MAG TPA: disulfide bond formation protein DsbA [Gammaproteobacteria bacterium]|nr:disulfide bond formation protein DsbA [Gammaproteobacteria bacterium]